MKAVTRVARELRYAVELVRRDRRNASRVLTRGIGVLRASVLLRSCDLGERVHADGYVRVVADGAVWVGSRVQLAHGRIPTELVCADSAELVIGDDAVISWGVSLEATRSIRIGQRCLVASMVRIRDCGENGIAEVAVGDDVWLARGAIIEPGVTIGDGSVVAANSVVRADVPPRSLASGNPATAVPIIVAPKGVHGIGGAAR